MLSSMFIKKCVCLIYFLIDNLIVKHKYNDVIVIDVGR